MKERKDLSNERFGKLTVIERAPDKIDKQGRRYKYWRCKCSCNRDNNFLAYESNLLLNKTTQCNFCRYENVSKANKKENAYDLSGEYGVGTTFNTNKQFYFDLDDYDKVKKYCWRETPNGYIASTTPDGVVYLHRLILELPIALEKDELMGDHIKGKRYDNRKSQLRKCLPENNALNRSVRKDNASGVGGVTWEKDRKKWKATLSYRGKVVLCKRFERLEEAVSVRKEAEKKYFGEYSRERYIEEED